MACTTATRISRTITAITTQLAIVTIGPASAAMAEMARPSNVGHEEPPPEPESPAPPPEFAAGSALPCLSRPVEDFELVSESSASHSASPPASGDR
ncbi:MAG: hypothetical protein KDA79_06835 [Planctomycetaceae bacterium]|nr:hypothetical protein [Planctomycetaceae bacterium]